MSKYFSPSHRDDFHPQLRATNFATGSSKSSEPQVSDKILPVMSQPHLRPVYNIPMQGQLIAGCNKLRRKNTKFPKDDELLKFKIRLHTYQLKFLNFDDTLSAAGRILAMACLRDIREHGVKAGLTAKVMSCLAAFTSTEDRWTEVGTHLRDILAWMVPKHTDFLMQADPTFPHVFHRDIKRLSCLPCLHRNRLYQHVEPNLLIHTWNEFSVPIAAVFTVRDSTAVSTDFDALQCLYALACEQKRRFPGAPTYSVTAILRKPSTCQACTKENCRTHQDEKCSSPMKIRILEALIPKTWLDAVQSVNSWRNSDMPWSFDELRSEHGVNISATQWFQPMPNHSNLQRFVESFGNPSILKGGNSEARVLTRQAHLLGTIMQMFSHVLTFQQTEDERRRQSFVFDQTPRDKLSLLWHYKQWRAYAALKALYHSEKAVEVRMARMIAQQNKLQWLEKLRREHREKRVQSLRHNSSDSSSSYSSDMSMDDVVDSNSEGPEMMDIEWLNQDDLVYPSVGMQVVDRSMIVPDFRSMNSEDDGAVPTGVFVAQTSEFGDSPSVSSGFRLPEVASECSANPPGHDVSDEELVGPMYHIVPNPLRPSSMSPRLRRSPLDELRREPFARAPSPLRSVQSTADLEEPKLTLDTDLPALSVSSEDRTPSPTDSDFSETPDDAMNIQEYPLPLPGPEVAKQTGPLGFDAVHSGAEAFDEDDIL